MNLRVDTYCTGFSYEIDLRQNEVDEERLNDIIQQTAKLIAREDIEKIVTDALALVQRLDGYAITFFVEEADIRITFDIEGYTFVENPIEIKTTESKLKKTEKIPLVEMDSF